MEGKYGVNWDKFNSKTRFNPNQYLDIRDNKNIVYGEVVIDKKDMIGDLGVECVMVDFDLFGIKPSLSKI